MKKTFLQSPVIAFQHIKNSAWAIEKLYIKTCVRKGFLSVIYTPVMMVKLAQFLPVSRRNSRLKKALWYMASPKINHFNFTSAEK